MPKTEYAYLQYWKIVQFSGFWSLSTIIEKRYYYYVNNTTNNSSDRIANYSSILLEVFYHVPFVFLSSILHPYYPITSIRRRTGILIVVTPATREYSQAHYTSSHNFKSNQTKSNQIKLNSRCRRIPWGQPTWVSAENRAQDPVGQVKIAAGLLTASRKIYPSIR